MEQGGSEAALLLQACTRFTLFLCGNVLYLYVLCSLTFALVSSSSFFGSNNMDSPLRKLKEDNKGKLIQDSRRYMALMAS